LNPLGVKGVGEAGVIPTPAAIISAVENALSPFRVRIAQTPISPQDVVGLILDAEQRMEANGTASTAGTGRAS
jgi:carbon-monoxide dehydrogenase large subunit